MKGPGPHVVETVTSFLGGGGVGRGGGEDKLPGFNLEAATSSDVVRHSP